MSRQAVKIWNEASYGVFANPGSPVKNTDYIVASLDQGNAFTMRPHPVQYPIRTADGFNRRMKMVAGQTKVTGKLTTLLYPEHVPFVMNWASALNTNTDLNSCTIDHQFPDASYATQYRRYLGCKVQQLKLSFTADSPLCRAEIDIVAQKPATPNITVTDFPDPPPTQYPVGNPFCFFHMATPGNLTLSSSRSEFREFSVTLKNMIDSPFFEGQYVTRANWLGRDVDFSAKLALKGGTDRLAYEANTAESCSARFDNGTNHLILNLNTANFFTGVEDDLALDKVYYQALSFSNFYDGTAGNDFSYTYA